MAKRAIYELAEWFALFDEPTRLLITAYLSKVGTANVTQIAKELKIEIVNCSHHLGVLRAARAVETEKNGRFMLYKLKNCVVTDGQAGFTHPPSGTVVMISLDKLKE